MSKHWYVREVPTAEPVGPFTTQELRAAVQAGQYRDALVATDGATEWRPLLSEIAGEDPLGNASTVVHGTAPSLHAFPSAPPPGLGPPPGQESLPTQRASLASISGHGRAPAPRATTASLVTLVVSGALLLGLLAFGIGLLLRKGVSAKGVAQGIVRVVLPSGSGTGFVVAGPDDLAYVATAYHVVASGEPILIEQTLEGTAGHTFQQAYPDVEVVAFDADADVAIVRLNGVTREHFKTFTLAKAAAADEAVLSYGFPGSSLAHKFGMVSKPGKVLSLVRFPVIDHRSGEVVRSDAISGLLVSVDIEPGFSGGPTLDEKGEVVGVNVTKDLAHRGQNGAVEVSVLRDLLTKVTPAAAVKDPTPQEIQELLSKVEKEYLLLPIDKRKTTREDDFVSTSDLPRVGELITTIRRLENDTSRRPDTKISGAAGLGIVLARLPGKPLETYTDRSTKKAMADCEVRERGLREFFGSLAASKGAGGSAAEEARAKCSELAFRPLVWDLTSLALHWEGQPREASVSKVEAVDPDRHIYRAAVRFVGIDHLVDVWLGGDGGRLRLKLFDAEGEASGLSSTGAQAVSGSAFAGTWRRNDARVAHTIVRGVDSDWETDETLAVVMTGDGAASLTHQFKRKVFMTGSRRLSCGGSVLSLGIEQSFSGSLDSGTITATRTKEAKALGPDMAHCGEALGYSPDLVFVLKMVGEKLFVYRTAGAEYPEVAEFRREL